MEGFKDMAHNTYTMSESDERKTVTVAMPQEMVEQIETDLDYGDSRAGWIREAIRRRMDDEELIEQPAN